MNKMTGSFRYYDATVSFLGEAEADAGTELVRLRVERPHSSIVGIDGEFMRWLEGLVMGLRGDYGAPLKCQSLVNTQGDTVVVMGTTTKTVKITKRDHETWIASTKETDVDVLSALSLVGFPSHLVHRVELESLPPKPYLVVTMSAAHTETLIALLHMAGYTIDGDV